MVGSFAFLILAPGVVAGLVPWLISGWRGSAPLAVEAVGWVAVVAGVGVLLSAFARFALDGLGTPAPLAPTERLVVSGAYRHVRNPMYLAVIAIIGGQAAILASSVLVVYAAVVLATFVAFVRRYEQPALSERYGVEYEAYREAVPGWLPRLGAWEGPGPDGSQGGEKRRPPCRSAEPAAAQEQRQADRPRPPGKQ